MPQMKLKCNDVAVVGSPTHINRLSRAIANPKIPYMDSYNVINTFHPTLKSEFLAWLLATASWIPPQNKDFMPESDMKPKYTRFTL